MKYLCVKEYWIEDIKVMSPGDIMLVENNILYNLNTKAKYSNVQNEEQLLKYLVLLEEAPVDNITAFNNIIKEMYDIFKKKNHDYGNSFEQSLDEEGLAAARIRIGDKWNRFKTLSKGNIQQVNDESLRDTLLDSANYFIMTAMWLDKQK